jgi:hypothetical protein
MTTFLKKAETSPADSADRTRFREHEKKFNEDLCALQKVSGFSLEVVHGPISLPARKSCRLVPGLFAWVDRRGGEVL